MDRNVGESHEQLVSIRAAAERLGVSTKTIHRHVSRGHLTKVKIGTRTFLEPSELDACSMIIGRDSRAGRDGHPRDKRTDNRDTVTLPRQRYEELLIELGELRKQNELLLAERTQLEARAASWMEQERELSRVIAQMGSGEGLTSDVQKKLDAAREKIEKLEGELAHFRAQKQWWQR